MHRFSSIEKCAAMCLLALTLVFASCQSSEDKQGEEGENAGKVSMATFAIHFPDSAPYEYTFDFEGSASVGAAMSKHPVLRIEMKEYAGMGRLVTGINAFNNDDEGGRYWQFCVNGVVAPKGIDDTPLQDGDRVDWHFVPYNELPCKKLGE